MKMYMTFKPEEVEEWHRNRRAESDKSEAGRRAEHSRAHRASAIAVCLHCHNPFGFGEGVITDEVQMCYICLD